MNPGVREIDVVRVTADADSAATDLAAAEEPLELRLGDQRFAVIMRTPGADFDLAAGFLLSERIVCASSDLAAIRYATDADGRDLPNVLSVWLQGDALARGEAAASGRRNVTSNASCGVCGRQTIDDLVAGIRVLETTHRVRRDAISGMPDALRAAQCTFDRTGGLHAAGLFDLDGRLLHIAEDVGRHNAVDKVVGASLRAGQMPLADRVLFVSGRTSFEVIQKANVAGISIVAAVSAPSSMAIELARDCGLTLLGFVRGRSFNIYAGQERIVR